MKHHLEDVTFYPWPGGVLALHRPTGVAVTALFLDHPIAVRPAAIEKLIVLVEAWNNATAKHVPAA